MQVMDRRPLLQDRPSLRRRVLHHPTLMERQVTPGTLRLQRRLLAIRRILPISSNNNLRPNNNRRILRNSSNNNLIMVGTQISRRSR